MAYNIGQFKSTQKTQKSNYETAETIDFGEKILSDKTPYGNSTDGAVTIKNNTFKSGNLYHLKTTLSFKGSGFDKIRVKLKDEQFNKFQTIKIISRGDLGSIPLDIIFMPQYDSFKHIVFEIERNNSYLANDTNTFVYAGSSTTLSKMINLIGTEQEPINVNKVKQIGIQGPQGLHFAINGADLKMGKDGIFMSEEMEITSLVFAIDDTAVPFFTVDYIY